MMPKSFCRKFDDFSNTKTKSPFVQLFRFSQWSTNKILIYKKFHGLIDFSKTRILAWSDLARISLFLIGHLWILDFDNSRDFVQYGCLTIHWNFRIHCHCSACIQHTNCARKGTKEKEFNSIADTRVEHARRQFRNKFVADGMCVECGS